MTQHLVDPSEVLLELGLSTATTEEQRAIVSLAIADAEGAIRRHLRYDPVLVEHTEYHPQQPMQAQISRGIWEVMEQRAVLRQVAEAATNELQLQHVPVRYCHDATKLKVWVDYDGRSGARAGSFPSTSAKTLGSDFWPNVDGADDAAQAICRDGVLRTIGLWPTTVGTVKITYTAGYSDDELRGRKSLVDATPIWSVARAESARRVRRILAMKKGVLGLPAGIKTSEGLGDYNYSLDGESVKRLFGGDLLEESFEALSEFVNWGYSLGS